MASARPTDSGFEVPTSAKIDVLPSRQTVPSAVADTPTPSSHSAALETGRPSGNSGVAMPATAAIAGAQRNAPTHAAIPATDDAGQRVATWLPSSDVGIRTPATR